MKGSFAEHYVRAKLLMATQKACKWAVRQPHQSSCQIRFPIIIYGHNWSLFPQAVTLHWWIRWWLCSAQRSGSSKKYMRKRWGKVCFCSAAAWVSKSRGAVFTWYKNIPKAEKVLNLNLAAEVEISNDIGDLEYFGGFSVRFKDLWSTVKF